MDERRLMSILSDYKNGHENLNRTIELLQLNEQSEIMRTALKEIVEIGLCNLPDVRCDCDMFNIANECLKLRL